MDPQPWKQAAWLAGLGTCAVVAAVGCAVSFARLGQSSAPKTNKTTTAKQVVEEFLHRQSMRDLDGMCAMVDDDVTYVNEPHPPERHIHGIDKFRAAFASSPCIWCEDAELKLLRISHEPGSDTVFVERLDQFCIDGVWLRIPICGYLVVNAQTNKIKFWKDYWCYAKYKEFTTKAFGPEFRLFRATVVDPTKVRG